MRLFYFKEKPTTPLRHLIKNLKKTHVPVKKLICKEVFKAFMKTKEKGGNIYKDNERLAEVSSPS